MINFLEKFWIIFYIVQMIIAIVIVVKSLIAKKKIPLEKIAILILIPIFGLFIPFLGVLLPHKKQEGDLDDVFDHDVENIRNDIRYEKIVEIEKEINYVPLDEAIILNNASVKRELILDLSKNDARGYLGFLRLAMEDSDMETSHYAASLIMEVNRTFQSKIQKCIINYNADPTNVDNLKSYVDIMEQYYNSGLLDENNEQKYALEYSKLMGELLQSGYYSEKLFKEKINIDIKLDKLDNLFSWVSMYKEKYPESEAPYLLTMKYYYYMNDIAGIKQVLGFLEQSHINKTLKGEDMIRYWKTVM